MESTNCKLWPNTLHAAKPWTNERQASKSIMGKLFKCWKRVCFLRPFFLRRNPSLLWASFFSKAPPNAGRHETISMRWSLFPWPTIGRTNGTKSPSDRLQVSTTIWFETKSVFRCFFGCFEDSLVVTATHVQSNATQNPGNQLALVGGKFK